MMKNYMYKSIVTSPYNVRTLLLCTDKRKLELHIKDERYYKDFHIGAITKSGVYCEDGNTEIHSKTLN